jgi:hypothetical protein
MSFGGYSRGIQKRPEFIRGTGECMLCERRCHTYKLISMVRIGGGPGLRPMKRRIRSSARQSRSGVGRWAYADGGAYPGVRGFDGDARATTAFVFGFGGLGGGIGGVEGFVEGFVLRSSCFAA